MVLYESPIKVEPQVRFLDMILDEHLLYLSHIQNLKACCHRPLYLRHLPSITWGANGAILLGLFISLVRSKLDYSCTFMARRLKSYLSLLDPIQNEGLRIATSDFGSSPKEFLEVKAGVIYLSLRRDLLMCFLYVCRRTPSTLGFDSSSRHFVS